MKTATAADEKLVFDAMLLAFVRDPLARWAYPDPQGYLANFSAFASAMGGKAFDAGTAHYVGDFSGAAMWLPPGVEPDGGALGGVIVRSVSPDKLQTFEELGAGLRRYRPPGNHWYLAFIGVNPMEWGSGSGSALLRHGLELVDKERSVAHLDASSPENVRLYQRHGFEVTGTVQVGDAPPITSMTRRRQ